MAIDFVRNLPLLSGLSSEDVADILCLHQELSPNDELAREGDASGGLFFIERGRFAVYKNDTAGNRQLVTELVAPTVVGEMTLLDDAPRSATVVALTPAAVYRVESARFRDLLSQGHAGAHKLVRNIALVLCDRLRDTNREIDRLLQDPALALEKQQRR